MKATTLSHSLNQKIIRCRRCSRLRDYCTDIGVNKRKSYQDWKYWAKPVPNFGDLPCKLLIVGLAPAAHGANRTGRMFTGDRSGEWLYKALHQFGFATQANSESIDDGLKLIDCSITAVAHCAPPQNKPTLDEIENCLGYLKESIRLSNANSFLALGQLAWKELFRCLKEEKLFAEKLPKFFHGNVIELLDSRKVFASYHPSQQNTFTGKLTEKMFHQIFSEISRS